MGFKLRAADAMAKEVDRLVQRGVISSRSELADARQDYSEPFRYAAKENAVYQRFRDRVLAIARCTTYVRGDVVWQARLALLELDGNEALADSGYDYPCPKCHKTHYAWDACPPATVAASPRRATSSVEPNGDPDGEAD